MSKIQRSKNDLEWEKLFDRYDIVNQIEKEGLFHISSAQIKEYREPRLMVKFDHTVNLPKLFADNQLSILPLTRGDYVISHFDAYHKFEESHCPVKCVSLPSHIQSLDEDAITNEAIALNCAVASGILADFLEDENLLATVSGRMSSGLFSFNIAKQGSETSYKLDVNNAQIEIDAAYEGGCGLAVFEAKRDLADDFLIRQLYYPYRVWQGRIKKPVKPFFLTYSNGIYHLSEYWFQNMNDYNSLVLVKQQNYSIENTTITSADIQAALNCVMPAEEPTVPFPQADNFERVINMCELLNSQVLSHDEITEQYAFDARQTNYYTDAARYLGLIRKDKGSDGLFFSLSKSGADILKMKYKKRQMAYCRLILSHQPFAEVLRLYLNTGSMPDTNTIVEIMKASNLYNVESDSTFERRSSTVKGWINWIVGLINE